jgi:transposase-like protein
MRRPRVDFDRALLMSTQGMTATSIARVLGVATSTVTRWMEKAGAHAKRFSEERLEIQDATEVQIDELNVRGNGKAERTWAYSALEVWSRCWIGTRVAKRTLRSTLLFVRGIQGACSRSGLPILLATDEFKYYAPVIARVFGPTAAHVEVKNRYSGNRVVRSTWRLVNTPEHRYDFARDRSEDSKRPNTAYVERLNLFERRSCSYLQRRTPHRARKPQRLESFLEVLRAYYNFIRPHSSLRFGKVTRTPAMQAGLTKRALSFRDIMSWVAPASGPTRSQLAEWSLPVRRPVLEGSWLNT